MHIAWHPIIVHLPVALVVVCVIFDCGRWVFGREQLLRAGFWGGSTPYLIFAFVSAINAMATGLKAEDQLAVKTESITALVEAHETVAFIVLGLLAILTFWRIALRGQFPARGGFVYLVLLIALGAAVGFGAHLGGQLVFSNGAGVGIQF